MNTLRFLIGYLLRVVRKSFGPENIFTLELFLCQYLCFHYVKVVQLFGGNEFALLIFSSLRPPQKRKSRKTKLFEIAPLKTLNHVETYSTWIMREWSSFYVNSDGISIILFSFHSMCRSHYYCFLYSIKTWEKNCSCFHSYLLWQTTKKTECFQHLCGFHEGFLCISVVSCVKRIWKSFCSMIHGGIEIHRYWEHIQIILFHQEV